MKWCRYPRVARRRRHVGARGGRQRQRQQVQQVLGAAPRPAARRRRARGPPPAARRRPRAQRLHAAGTQTGQRPPPAPRAARDSGLAVAARMVITRIKESTLEHGSQENQGMKIDYSLSKLQQYQRNIDCT